MTGCIANRGTTLLEALVLLALLAIGGLGVLTTQVQVLRAGHMATQHALADLMALDLRERIRVVGAPGSDAAWLAAWRLRRDCRTGVDHFCLPGIAIEFLQNDGELWMEISWQVHRRDPTHGNRTSLRWPMADGGIP